MSVSIPFHAVIVAGGRGERAGLPIPKQFANFAGRPLLRWSVQAFAAHPSCVSITIVVPDDPESRALAADAVAGTEVRITSGGATRQLSVAAGLAALDDAAEIALVHDAARPGIDAQVIDALLAPFQDRAVSGTLPALPVADTLSRVDAHVLDAVVDREKIVRIQTPQAFRLAELRKAHANWAGVAATDDAQMVRMAGGRIIVVPGSRKLEKITLNEDFQAVEAMLAPSKPAQVPARVATGMGFDVHRLIPGEGLWMGGVFIPFHQKLEGHSDADVVLHAITDAVLGAIGEGDIGTHFPPSDAQWRGAPSDRFLDHARRLVEAQAGSISHVDCTLICEAPKVGPHRSAMRSRIAEILRVPEEYISIKATTTERLGFTGRGEGIAAQAIATVVFPASGSAP